MAYTDIASIKAYIGVSGTTYDAFMTSSMNHMAELVDEWCGRNFYDVTPGAGFDTHSVSQTVHMDRDDYWVQLREWPVASVQSLVVDDSTVLAARYSLDSTTGKIRFLSASGYPEMSGVKVEATYVAGFASTPASVINFITRGVSYLFARRDAEGLGADLVGETQVTYRNNNELRKIFDETCSTLVLDMFK